MASDPHREHLHNQLICAIHTNVFRDPPDATVAGWVSANDKPTMGLAKPAMGDAAELRLKNEVMQLPPRARHRLKGVKDVSYNCALPARRKGSAQLYLTGPGTSESFDAHNTTRSSFPPPPHNLRLHRSCPRIGQQYSPKYQRRRKRTVCHHSTARPNQRP